MTEIINLRRVRKAKDREEAAKVAAENRARHGRDKATKEREALEKSLAERQLAGHRLDDDV